MIGSYRAEWSLTGRGTRIAVGIWLLVILLMAANYGVRALLVRDFAGVEWAGIGLVWALLFKVLWPFTLGVAIRRRGGSFGVWFVMGFLFGIIITGIWYLFTLRKLPIVESHAGLGLDG